MLWFKTQAWISIRSASVPRRRGTECAPAAPNRTVSGSYGIQWSPRGIHPSPARTDSCGNLCVSVYAHADGARDPGSGVDVRFVQGFVNEELFDDRIQFVSIGAEDLPRLPV